MVRCPKCVELRRAYREEHALRRQAERELKAVRRELERIKGALSKGNPELRFAQKLKLSETRNARLEVELSAMRMKLNRIHETKSKEDTKPVKVYLHTKPRPRRGKVAASAEEFLAAEPLVPRPPSSGCHLLFRKSDNSVTKVRIKNLHPAEIKVVVF